MGFDHNLKLHPFYQYAFDNSNDIQKQLVYFDHTKINFLEKDCFQDK